MLASDIWSSFDTKIIKNSIDVCGITSKKTEDFHMTLKNILNSNNVEETVK